MMGRVQMSSALDIVLFGIGGFGGVYVSALLDALPRGGLRLAGVVDPYPASCRQLSELKALGIPVFTSPELAMQKVSPQLAVLATPIPFHHEQILGAMRGGAHVLVEKPLCATFEQGREVARVARQLGRHVAVGFQWSFGDAVRELKRDARAGLLGRPRRFRTLVLWPRRENYYTRNDWAGRVEVGGRAVFDSPVSNACSHFLHNMLYVLGESPESAAMPVRVCAELYRRQAIDNYDTAAVRCWTAGGTELLFLTSHSTAESVGPVCEYEFDHATVTYDEASGGHFVARFDDGRVKDYGRPPSADEPGKLFDTIAAIRAGRPSVCGADAALPHLAVTCAATASVGEIVDFPAGVTRITTDGKSALRYVDGLADVLTECYRRGRLPSELTAERAVPWAVAGTEVAVDAAGNIRRVLPATGVA